MSFSPQSTLSVVTVTRESSHVPDKPNKVKVKDDKDAKVKVDLVRYKLLPRAERAPRVQHKVFFFPLLLSSFSYREKFPRIYMLQPLPPI